MPIRFFFVNRTPEQIANEGLLAVRKKLLDDAMSGEMAFLSDGREYIVRFRRPDPQPVNGNPALLQVQLIIEWTVGNYAQARVGEYVHGELLRPTTRVSMKRVSLSRAMRLLAGRWYSTQKRRVGDESARLEPALRAWRAAGRSRV